MAIQIATVLEIVKGLVGVAKGTKQIVDKIEHAQREKEDAKEAAELEELLEDRNSRNNDK